MSLAGVVGRRVADYSVEIHNPSSIIGTRVIAASKTTETKSLAIFKLDFKDLRHAPEGQWNSQDIKMYEIGAPTIALESVVTFESSEYRVMMVSNRNKDGGFSMYWAKHIGVNETSTE